MPRRRPLFVAVALAGVLLAGGRADANPDVRGKEAQAQAIVAQGRGRRRGRAVQRRELSPAAADDRVSDDST